jgi:hypothetical protein
MSLIVACSGPIAPSLRPSAAVSAEPTTIPTPNPTLESTPDPTPSIAAPAFTWQRHVLPGLDYRSVIAYKGRFLALGPARGDKRDQVSVLRSEDGLAWRTAARRPFDGQNPLSMALVDGRLIVTAWRNVDPESIEPFVWTSTDGMAWEVWFEPQGLPISTNVARIDGRWLYSSRYADGLQSSLDGTHWTTELLLHPAADSPGFAVGPGGVLAPVTQEGENGPGRSWMYLTNDGIEWTESDFDDAADTWIQRVAANDSGYVAIGWGSYQRAPSVGRVWWSPDGATWERARVPSDFGRSQYFAQRITPFRDGFVAAVNPSEEGPQRLLWSGDGRDWSYVDGGPKELFETTGLIIDGDRVLWFGFELTDPEVRTLWEAVPAT